MGTQRESTDPTPAVTLQARLRPYVEHIESECALAVAELLGSSRKNFNLTTGTRLDIIRSLEAARAACDSMLHILQNNCPDTANAPGGVL